MSFIKAIGILNKVTTNVLGIPIVYTHSADSTEDSCKGIFSNEFVEMNGVSTLRPVLRINLADMSAAPLESDTVLVNGTTYTVRVHQADGNGGSTLILQLD